MISKIKGLLSGERQKKLLSEPKTKTISSSPKIMGGYKVIKETANTALVRDDRGNEIWIKK